MITSFNVSSEISTDTCQFEQMKLTFLVARKGGTDNQMSRRAITTKKQYFTSDFSIVYTTKVTSFKLLAVITFPFTLLI